MENALTVAQTYKLLNIALSRVHRTFRWVLAAINPHAYMITQTPYWQCRSWTAVVHILPIWWFIQYMCALCAITFWMHLKSNELSNGIFIWIKYKHWNHNLYSNIYWCCRFCNGIPMHHHSLTNQSLLFVAILNFPHLFMFMFLSLCVSQNCHTNQFRLIYY